MTDRNHLEDADDRAAWELLGRHDAIEPSFGFVERTLRRLHEEPVPQRRLWEWPALRWGLVTALVALVGLAGWLRWENIQARRVEVYVAAQQDRLEDFDVIASLDTLGDGDKL